MKKMSLWLLILLEHFYHLLLFLYPPPFRSHYGKAMEHTFRTLCRDVYLERGLRGVLVILPPALVDVVCNAFAEYVSCFVQFWKGTDLMNVSFLLPVFNEEHTLETVVTQAQQELAQTFEQYEIIVVNDGSQDLTAQVADRLAATFPQTVRVVHLPANKGYHHALSTGVAQAKGDHVMCLNRNQPFQFTWPHLQKHS